MSDLTEHDTAALEPGAALTAPEPACAPVIMLRPIRTMTIARDLAFRQRAMTVLADLGPAAFAVAALEEPDDVVALVVQQRADVVILDVTVSAPALAHVVLALSERVPRVGVIVVSDHVECAGHALPVLAKWGWAADLSRAVQDAYRHGNPLKEASDARHQQH
ncbi:MAG: hypothetical protein WKF48_12145 [Solirubrobacteraceae bacterium]